MTKVNIYTDGACSGNQLKTNKGGWGAVLEYGDFRPPVDVTQPSTCPWIDRPVSGLHPETYRPIKTRFRYGSPIRLTSPLNVTR